MSLNPKAGACHLGAHEVSREEPRWQRPKPDRRLGLAEGFWVGSRSLRASLCRDARFLNPLEKSLEGARFSKVEVAACITKRTTLLYVELGEDLPESGTCQFKLAEECLSAEVDKRSVVCPEKFIREECSQTLHRVT